MPLFNPGQSATIVWISPTFANGWSNYGNYFDTAGYCKVGDVVYLKGLVKAGSGTIFTLPAGYRPSKQRFFMVATGGSGSSLVPGRIDIASDGSVTFIEGQNGYVSLDGITFRL